MRPRGRSWRKFSSAATLVAGLACLLACSRTVRHVSVGETFAMGEFRMRVESFAIEDRRHQGVPLDVEVRLSCDGGTRFDRIDLAEVLSKRGRAYVRAHGGWRERVYLSASAEGAREMVGHAYPPPGSQGYVLDLESPYGRRERIEVDLGR